MKEQVVNSLHEVLKRHICTLKGSSLNEEHKVYMCDSLISVVDFDQIPKEYVKGKGWSLLPKSNDA